MSSKYVTRTRRPQGALSWLTQIAFLASLTVFFITSLGSTVLAAAGPHGDFNSKTEKCERCHSVHTAKTQTLLQKNTIQDLCVSCHSKGIGADTAVMDGALLRPVSAGSSVYDNLGTLLGGGFDSIGTTASSTSRHIMGTATNPPGGTGGATIVLDCMSCHTPHDSPNYRMLRRRPNGIATDITVAWNGPWKTTTVDADGKTVVTTDNAYVEQSFGAGLSFDAVARTYSGASKEVTRNYKSGVAAWCSSCHSAYMSRQDLVAYDAGDAEGAAIRYRHAVDVPITGVTNEYISTIAYDFQTDLPLEDKTGLGRSNDDTMTCLTCHKAHGSSALMTGRAVLVSAADRGTLPAGEDSMLLRLNNRQVCQTACHRVVK